MVAHGIADLDGDGKGDVVWRGTDGTIYGWLMNGGTIASQGVIGNPGTQWVIADLADMDGDSKADIVFRNVNDGGIYVYFMNGLAMASGGFVGSSIRWRGPSRGPLTSAATARRTSCGGTPRATPGCGS